MSEENKNSKYTIEWFAKLIGLIAVIVSIFGVSFQKGMIMAMNLGNLSGSYEIREVFNSAVLGIVFAFGKVTLIDYWTVISNMLWVVLIFTLFGFIASLIFKNRTKINSFISKAKTQSTSLKHFILGSCWISSILGSLFGITIVAIGAAFWYLVFASAGVLLLPAILGYFSGAFYIEQAMDNPTCVKLNDEILNHKIQNHKRVRQCTQVLIKGKAITGEIVLENSDAYFIQHESAFIYVTKNGENCVYSTHSNSNSIKEKDVFKFEDEIVKQFCFPRSQDQELTESINDEV